VAGAIGFVGNWRATAILICISKTWSGAMRDSPPNKPERGSKPDPSDKPQTDRDEPGPGDPEWLDPAEREQFEDDAMRERDA
jgi:hypothetical protein